MSTSPVPLDPATLQATLARAMEQHANVEKLGREKAAQITQLRGQLAQTNVELERLRGAADFSTVVIKDLRDSLDRANAMAAAAKAATELAALTATVPQA